MRLNDTPWHSTILLHDTLWHSIILHQTLCYFGMDTLCDTSLWLQDTPRHSMMLHDTLHTLGYSFWHFRTLRNATQHSKILYDIPWHSMKLYSMILWDSLRHFVTLFNSPWHYDIPWHSIRLHDISGYSKTLFYTQWHSNLP